MKIPQKVIAAVVIDGQIVVITNYGKIYERIIHLDPDRDAYKVSWSEWSSTDLPLVDIND